MQGIQLEDFIGRGVLEKVVNKMLMGLPRVYKHLDECLIPQRG